MKTDPKKIKIRPAKKVVKHDAHTTTEVKQYLGVLAEDFQHRVSAIAEQFLGLHEKLDEHGKKLDEHGKKLDEHGKILNSHTEMIGRLMIDVEEIKVGMHEKVSRSEFDKLESRLVSLESFVFSGRGKTPKTSKNSK